MLKTVSAALVAVSMIAAPALAANSGTQSPVNKTTQTQTSQSQAQTPAANAQAKTTAKVRTSKSKKLNAHAKMMRRHPHHKKVSVKSPATSAKHS
ncbi:MAG: His-rich protein BRANT [Gemmatimonas sp.]